MFILVLKTAVFRSKFNTYGINLGILVVLLLALQIYLVFVRLAVTKLKASILTGVGASHLKTANLLLRCEKKIIIAKCVVDKGFKVLYVFVKNSEIISLRFFL